MRGCLASSSAFLAERKVGEQNCSAGLIKILFEAWWSANCPQKIKTLVQANGFLLHIKYSLIEAQKLCKWFLRNVTKKTPHRRGIQGKLFKFKEKNVVMTQGKCFLPCAREGGGCGIREMGGSPNKKKLQMSSCFFRHLLVGLCQTWNPYGALQTRLSLLHKHQLNSAHPLLAF